MLRQPKVIRNDLSIYVQVDPWWDETSLLLDPLRRLAQPRMAYLSRFVDPVGQRLLDVGCGGGFLSKFFPLVPRIGRAAGRVDVDRRVRPISEKNC